MVKMNIHTEERDRIKGIIEKYQCSPFDGQCYTEEVTFYRDSKTGLFHIILAPQTVDKFQLFEDEYVDEGMSRGKPSMSMIMIKPTASDNNYIFFRRK